MAMFGDFDLKSSYQPSADLFQAAAPAAASAPFAATPGGAAAMVGSQVLMNYLANKAASERAQRERAAQIEQEHGSQQQRGIESLMNAWRGALR